VLGINAERLCLTLALGMTQSKRDAILEFMRKNQSQDFMISQIAEGTGINRNTVAKYLWILNEQKKVTVREIGKAKLFKFMPDLKPTEQKPRLSQDDSHFQLTINLLRLILKGNFGGRFLEKLDFSEKDKILVIKAKEPLHEDFGELRKFIENELKGRFNENEFEICK
jgi:hypothetical protein